MGDAIAYTWLTRCEFQPIPERQLDESIISYSDLYFVNGGSSAFSVFRNYLENRFNKVLTTETVRAEIRNEGILTIKDWLLDPTLRERLRTETDEYLRTYSPFGAGGSTIPRRQICELFDQISKPDGPNVVLLTGIAGSGKSGIIRGLIRKLIEVKVTHLALRIDHYLNCSTPYEIGQALTGRQESPVSTLKGLEPEGISVLIIDQVDAVSEVSGRNGIVKEAVLRMVNDVRNFKTVRLVLVCRSFDFNSDPRLKALKETNDAEQIEVPLLAWNDEVAPLLTEKGIDIKLLSSSQKALLCLPLHLAVFLEVYSERQSFASRNDLFESLIRRKDRSIRNYYNITWTAAVPLTALATWMSDRQRLNAPEAVLDNFLGAKDILASEGLIIRSHNSINFFHETFFDYLYARAFVVGNQSLFDLLTSTEQHLFRRTQTRLILEALRQDDLGRYFHELDTVLTSDAIRYHIKVAVAQWLGSLNDPMERERDIILQLDNENEIFRPLVRYALLSSVGWFGHLHRYGWIQANLNSECEKRCQSVLWWLANIADDRPTEVAALLDTWWGNDPERGDRLLAWFGFIRRKKRSDQSLVLLCEKVIRSRPPSLFGKGSQQRREMVFVTWAEENPDEGLRILKALFDTWFDAHPGQHPFERDRLSDLDMHTLRQVAEKSPRVFIEGTIDALMRSIDEINLCQAKGKQDYSFSHRAFSGHRFGADAFLGLFRSALRQVAREDPNGSLKFLSKLDASKHEAILHLHLESITANGEALADYLFNLLGKGDLFKAGWIGADWKSFADASRAAFPSLSIDDRLRIETEIFSYQPGVDYAIEIAHGIKEQGESTLWCNRRSAILYLNQAGFEQWCVLETIGEAHLTNLGFQHLKSLRRKFPGAKIPQPEHMEAHVVESPIKRDKAMHMNDAQWLRAIARYTNNDERRRERDFIYGGARELAGELQHAAKENPSRFAALMKIIPHEAHQTYTSHILWGLAETEEVEDDLLKEAVIEAHSRPGRPYGDAIARLFEKRPLIAEDPSVFDILAWYVENGEANGDKTTDSSNTENEILSIDDLLHRGGKLHIRGINGARGFAAEAMGAVIWQVPEIAEKAWSILERRIEREPLISVRCCLMPPLVPLFNVDRQRCAKLVERLVNRPSEIAGHDGQERSHASLSPLITHQGTYLLPFLLHWVPDTGQRLVNRLLDSGDETMHMIGAWHVFRHSFQDPAYIPQADRLIEEGVIYRRLAAGVASKVITSEEFRERAELQLIRFFDDEDEKVRRQAGDVFHQIEPNEFVKFLHLSHAYLSSQAFYDESFAFFHALKRATCSIHDLVILAAERLIVDLRIDGKTDDIRHFDLHQLQDLIKQEYAVSESNAELREKLLNVIDTMLERELYGTDEILKAYERE